MNTAEAIKALEEIRTKMMNNNTMIPNGNDSADTAVATVDDLKNELANPANLAKYKSDPKYQADWRARMEIASKNSGYIDKVGA
jgi:hypothetical protein